MEKPTMYLLIAIAAAIVFATSDVLQGRTTPQQAFQLIGIMSAIMIAVYYGYTHTNKPDQKIEGKVDQPKI